MLIFKINYLYLKNLLPSIAVYRAKTSIKVKAGDFFKLKKKGGKKVKAVWFPDNYYLQESRLAKFMQKLGYDDYEEFYQGSISNISYFWDKVVEDLQIIWRKKYEETLEFKENDPLNIKWFTNGQLNIIDSALDKWLKNNEVKNQPALIWEGENGESVTLTYQELHYEVNRLANGLKELGVSFGERVLIYLPMIKETVIAMLALAKIGAISVPVFSGYGVEAIRTRLLASEATFVITADGFYRRGKEVIMKEELEQAIENNQLIKKVIVVKRLMSTFPLKENEIYYHAILSDNNFCPNLPRFSESVLMLLYTSGTTGKPKGIVHTHSGFPIKAAFDAGYAMDLKQKERMFWYTDMGWMMGPFLIYATLLNGATMIIYEGSPDYPNPGRIWEIVERHRVTHLGISPTLIRSLMPFGDQFVNRSDLSSLRVIGSTGEAWNPEPWQWLFSTVGKNKVPIFNYSGGTEISGGILGNILLKPISPATFNSPIPGMAADVYDSMGMPAKNEVGELVIKKPWVGISSRFWQNDDRYYKTYWSRWPNTWLHGDWAIVDDDGFWTITGRSDDTLNIAGKRIGPAEIESAFVEHPLVVEAAAIGVPDEIKGEAIVCFVVLKSNTPPTEELRDQLFNLISTKLGKALKPKKIYFVNQLAKTRNGKIMRRVLKALYLGRDLGDISALENLSVIDEIRKLR